MTAPRVLSTPERGLGRRWKHLARERIGLAIAASNRLDDLARERVGLARDLADAGAELSEVRDRVFGYSTERRALEVERLSARTSDLERRIQQLDAEVARLRASRAGLEADARQAAAVFEKFRKLVNRAVDPHFYDELWS